MPQQRDELIDRTIAALLWIAAFAFATGIFLSATLLLRAIPPTPLIGVGRVTVERASKLRDYSAALLFFAAIAPLTIGLHRVAEGENERLRARATPRNRTLVSALFVGPYLLAPFLFLTTEKWGWPFAVPIALGALLPRAVLFRDAHAWMRDLLRRDMWVVHALVAAEALAWILFRYIATGKRIAHVPTLFLEIPFVVFIAAVFWIAFVVIARIATMAAAVPTPVALQHVGFAAMPLVLLPLLGVLTIRGPVAISIVMTLVIIAISIDVWMRKPLDARAIRRVTAYVIVPLLLFCSSYVSTAAIWESFDMFHRGESLGPASDYARGKVPYRDVFVLHGLLQDGLMDGWLIDLVGRNEDIIMKRSVLLGSFAAPALWYLGCVIFGSIPAATLVILLGAVTFVENDRALCEIIVVALFLAALKRRSTAFFVLAGIATALALFYSLDIGLYCFGGAILASVVLRRFRAIVPFVAGAIVGSAPFAIYLAMHGAFVAFVRTSFLEIPAIIDAVWSLPFPDFTASFRHNVSLRTIADFFLDDRFRFILNPLIIGIAIVVVVGTFLRRERGWLDDALVVLVCFAALTQRSALGRADFQHQHFSAFLVAPMLVILFRLIARAPRLLAVAAFVLLFPWLVVALWLPDIVNWRIDDTTHYRARYENPSAGPAGEVRKRIEDVRYEIAQLTRPGEPIYDFSNQPAFYFFCDRPNPTRFYQVPIMSPRAFQAEVIRDLERAKPKAVIRTSPQGFDEFDGIDNTIRAQAVAAYLDDHYAYAVKRDGVEIWKRRPEAAAVNAEVYLRRIHVPTEKEIGAMGARARVVFPWMTSQSGGAGTRWLSDLTLHNPLDLPMRLRLRYIAGDTRVDREVTLAPQRSVRWDDVVTSLFHAPETGGIVWVQYNGDRAPVARAQTYDSAHDRGGSIAEPLSAADTATAGTARDRLSVLGFSSKHTLVNIGVVNMGPEPAGVRIAVVTADGATAGNAIEQTVGEDQAFVVSDAETALGVRLDATMTVRIDVLAGSAAAFASTIESNGDTEFLAGVPSSQK